MTLTGSPGWHLGWPLLPERYVVVTDGDAARLSGVEAVLDGATAVYQAPRRPTFAAAGALLAPVRDTGATVIVSIGTGTTLDTGKLAVYQHRTETGVLLEHIAIPAGSEPYRAVVPLTTFDNAPGERQTLAYDWLRPREAAVVSELIQELSGSTIALFTGDAIVQASESLLSSLSTASSGRLAAAAIEVCAREARSREPDMLALVGATFDAASAFMQTKLGLAHALARSLGIAAGTTHDGFTVMVGVRVLQFWMAYPDAARRLPSIHGDASPTALVSLVEALRERAGLPSTLAESGLRHTDLQDAIAWAPHSSGIPYLPRAVTSGELAAILEAAWTGRPATAETER